MFTKDDKKWLELKFATKNDIEDLKTTFQDNLTKWKDELFTKIDSVLGRVNTAEEENIVLRAREDGRQEERVVLESRVKKLESIHPQNRHIQP